MAKKADLILLHPPSVYDFRKTSIMYGPVSDVVPSSPIFEMYPFGLSTIAEYLDRQNFSVRIINIALRMLKDNSFNAERLIKNLKTKAFGIDLHWLPHAHGALEIAKIVKKYHPRTPVIFGGFSATYYHKELIQYPVTDFVVRGDSTEQPMLELLRCIIKGESLSSVPNLTWKDEQGQILVNPFSYVPSNLDHITFDCVYNMKSVIKFRDLLGHLPFENWFEYPITPGLTCRGCRLNCVTCGGSATTFAHVLNRKEPAFRAPELLAEDMHWISQHIKAPIFIVGDIRQTGDDYAEELIEAISRKKITNQVCFEFFNPLPEELFKRISKALPHYSMEMSFESHDEEVRKIFGKNYSNQQAEDTIKYAFANNCERFDIYFMNGLPKQTKQSVLDTVEYCRYLYKKFDGDRRLLTFITPMAPFLDPGSIAFENPEQYGYKLFYKTLEEHRQALAQPSWKYILNYETQWMTRDDIVEVTYEAGLRLNRLKAEYGVINAKTANEVETRILRAQNEIKLIDEIMRIPDAKERELKIMQLKAQVDKLNESTVCEKKELEWPTGLINFRVFPIIRLLFSPFRKRRALKVEEEWRE